MDLKINIDVPGTLSEKIPEEIRDRISSLKISGVINYKDFDRVLDDMCTSLGEFDEYDNYTIDLADSPLLRHLDLGEATFISDHGELTYFGYHTQLESLILPQGISSILASGEYEAGFSRSDMLKTLIIPEGVKILRGVIDCPNLVELNIPQSVEQIDSFAFAGGSSITSIRLPRDLNSIDGSSFAGCNISRFELDSENPNFVEVDGVIFSKDLTRLVAFPSSYPHAKYQIPNTTKVIGWGAFMDSMINELIIPDSVETIEGWAFQGSKISTIVIPDSVKTIGELAFRWCDRLTCLKLSNSITEIPAQLISGCLSLKRIEIPGNVKKVDISALAWSYNLKEIIFHSGVEEISGCGPMLIKPSNLQRVVIPSTLKKIPGGAFSYSTNRYVFDVDSRNPYFTVKDGALYSKDCKRLISIPDRRRRKFVIPDGVTILSELIFHDMKFLEDVVLPQSLHTIESRAFQGCDSLRRLTIPPSVRSVDMDALWADNLKDVYLDRAVPPIMTGKVASKDWRFTKVRLHVPANSVSIYRNSPGWQCFEIVADISISAQIK